MFVKSALEEWVKQPFRRHWIFLLSVGYLIMGMGSLIFPQTTDSIAYSLVTDFAPVEFWGAMMLLSAGLGSIGLWINDRMMKIMSLGLSVQIQLMFGLSLFSLTLQGTSSGLFGAFQWWFVGAVSFYVILKGYVMDEECGEI